MKLKLEFSKEIKILLVCILIAVFLLLIGVLSGMQGVLGNTIILATFIVITPQLIFNYVNYRNLKDIEFYYPHFLRDLVESTRAGMPLHKAIIFASHTDYGALTSHIQKMAHQLSWNVNIIDVLEQARERLKKSNTLAKVFRILIETYNSGGSIDSTLDSLSNTMMTIQDTEKERKSTLNQYVIAMYVISLVFIGIIVGINWLMVPVFQSMSTSTTGGATGMAGIITNPCNTCVYGADVACTPCGIYAGVCSVFGTNPTNIGCYYLALFFSISIIQSLMGGLVAGQIGEGSVIAGIKHSLILVCITVAAFLILVPLGFIGG
jgi:flagellar protein FlaJ